VDVRGIDSGASAARANGDYADFVRGRTAALLRAALVLTGDQGLAEDLVQSALARTHLAWSRLSEQGNAEAYTRKVMYHLQVDCGGASGSWRRCPASSQNYPPTTTRTPWFFGFLWPVHLTNSRRGNEQ
jgi:hypothetical protein